VIAALLGRATTQPFVIDFLREIRRPMLTLVELGEMSFSEYVNRNTYFFRKRIIKECNLTPFVEELRCEFPSAPIVHIVRDPRDNIRSLLNRVGIAPRESRPKAGELPPGWRRVIPPAVLEAGGFEVVGHLARRWSSLNANAVNRDKRQLVVRYEDFCCRKRETIRGLAAKLDLPVRADVSEYLNFQFQPA